MSTTKLFVIFFSILITKAFTQTFIPPGDVSGFWTSAASPFYIQGEITIPNGETLTIESGVNVIFLGHYKFNIQGRLLATGTQLDSIHFTAENTDSGWHGIRFDSTSNTNDTSKMFYCSFRYGKANTGSGFDRCGGAILINYFDKVIISNCLFDHNMQSGGSLDPPQAGPAIFIYYASPLIKNSTFSNNTGALGSAIACVGSPNAIISHNILFNNTGLAAPVVAYGGGSPLVTANIVFNNTGTYGAGINSENGANARIENNIIFHNQAQTGAGIFSWLNAKPILINNTIAYNTSSQVGGGLGLYENADPVLINDIIYGNSANTSKQIHINDDLSDPNILYCNIEGGKEGFGGNGAGGNYSGLYENNIDTIPYFWDVLGDDFRLTDYSPCIGAGIDSIEIEGEWYHIPPFCIEGNPRPNPPGSMPDIGACENPTAIPLVGVEDEITLPTEFILDQNYPNPFNPTTTIGFGIQNKSNVKITVLSVIGEEVAVILNEEKEAGYHQVEFRAANLPSGVYFYQIRAGNFISTKKMILLK